MSVSKMLGEGKQLAKRLLGLASRGVWRKPLTRKETIDLLEDYKFAVTENRSRESPALDPESGERPAGFDFRRRLFEPEYIWKIERGRKLRSGRIVPSGTVLLNDKYLLDLDFGSYAGIIDRPFKTRAEEIDLVIAPWSHGWAAYYDFLIFVVGKLCRIKDALENSEWDSATICYPLLNTRFEHEYLSKLGLGQKDLVDTRSGMRLSAQSIIVSNNQTSWLPSPTTIHSLRNHLMRESSGSGARIYISRRDTRRVENEKELLRVLEGYDFDIIEHMPASVDEQINMFSSASIIVSPHGSALANLVWCNPGTYVLELFSRSFTQTYFHYISNVLGLHYAYLVDDSMKSRHWTNKTEDIRVDIEAVEGALQRTIKEEHHKSERS